MHYSYCELCGHEVVPYVSKHPYTLRAIGRNDYVHYDDLEGRSCNHNCEPDLRIVHQKTQKTEDQKREILARIAKYANSVSG